jgi:amidase
MALGTVKLPTPEQLRDVAADLGITFTSEDLASHLAAMRPGIDLYNILDRLPDELPAVQYPRTPGRRPSPEENTHNAWYVKTTIEGAPTGPLKGKRVVLKDNICLAGVPMMNGASTREGYVPEIDATVATRVLDAGGTIVGKAVCEYFCFAAGSYTSATGPVHNPRRKGYSAGGSSSGSAVLVALGEADMALGGDQGGSIRIPAAYCGIYGLKPTHGLVPYTGIMPIENTLDHTGPMTATVEDNALLLQVLAGPEGWIPVKMALSRRTIAPNLAGTQQDCGLPLSSRVSVIRSRWRRWMSSCAPRRNVSNPWARAWRPFRCPCTGSGWRSGCRWPREGGTVQMMLGNGFGFNWQGLYVASLLDWHSGWRNRADELSDTLKQIMLIGHYMVTHYRGRYYAKAQNLVRRLRAGYDAVLANHDLLLMPTVPMTAPKLPEDNAPLAELLKRGFAVNTAPFDCTHHPAMNVPCGLADGLPVGLMLVGRHCDEASIYRAAAAFERGVPWEQQTA